MFADATPLCPTASVRRYGGEHQAHAHDHAQLLFALHGRMELEVAGRSAFVDSSCGLAVPAGAVHAFLARPDTRLSSSTRRPAPDCSVCAASPCRRRHRRWRAAWARRRSRLARQCAPPTPA